MCGERNSLELDACARCQTPFRRLFEEPKHRPEIEPGTAVLWSLLLPGLGHWKAGYRADAVARMVLIAWTLGTVLLVLLSRSDAGFGSGFPLFVLYLVAAVAVYVVSAADAYRLAAGGEPLVSSRFLLWASAALVLASIFIATLITLPTTRR